MLHILKMWKLLSHDSTADGDDELVSEIWICSCWVNGLVSVIEGGVIQDTAYITHNAPGEIVVCDASSG